MRAGDGRGDGLLGHAQGQTAKVISKSGINTSNARVKLAKTDGLEVEEIRGNCLTGIFTDALGKTYKFEGRNRGRGSLSANYVFSTDVKMLKDEPGGELIYTTSMSAFRALCPAKMALPDEHD